MRLRIRGPNGQSTVLLPEDATVRDLRIKISEATSITDFDVKFGYPPVSLPLDEYQPSAQLSQINIRLNGEQLIVSDRVTSTNEQLQTQNDEPKNAPITKPQPSSTHLGTAPLGLSRKPPPTDPPEIPCPTHGATVVLRIMEDDNSCMFRAFNSAYFGAMDNMHELRSIIAQSIQSDPEKYSAVVLERNPDDYCRWIQSEDAWGGAIELDILSRHFDIEICSIDVQTLRIDRFNEGRLKRCVLVYSGIHYDVIALSPSDPPHDISYAPPDFDEKVFDAFDGVVLEKARELCRVLQEQHYYTDTASFSIRCNTCGGTFTGEKGATEHAAATGHYDFGEAT